MPKKQKKVRKVAHSMGDAILKRMEELITGGTRGGMLLLKLDEDLTQYLRGDGQMPNWDNYPNARTWFCQRTSRPAGQKVMVFS